MESCAPGFTILMVAREVYFPEPDRYIRFEPGGYVQTVKPLRHPLFAPILALVVAIGLAFLLALYMLMLPSLGGVWAGVFHQTASGWERLPKLAKMPTEVRVSGRGTVWW